MVSITKNYKSLLADFGLLYASAIWGTTFFMVKETVKNIDPVALCAYRFLLSAICLVPFLIYKRKALFQNIRAGIVVGTFLWLLYVSQTIGLVYTTASNAAFITGLFIVFIPIFGYIFFKRIPSLNNIMAVMIALIGLWILTGYFVEINKGDLITLITAVAYALHVLFVDRYIKENHDPYVLCFQQFLFVSILSFFASFIFNLPLSVNNFGTIKSILFLTFFPTLSAFLIQALAQRITAPIKVSLIFALEPVFGALFAWTLGGEIFKVNQVIGGLLIFVALIVHEIKISSFYEFFYSKIALLQRR